MADQPVTREKLINADKDVQTIEDFIKKSKDETVTTRFGDQIMTLKGLEEEVKKSGGYFKRYTSLAAANADIANIPVNSVVKVTDAVEGGDYERATAGAMSLTKSAYDPLTQAKAYSDANPLFKPVQVKAGDNPNNYLKSGIYYHWGANIAAADLPNWPVYENGNAVWGVLEVINPVDGVVSGLTQKFYPYLDIDYSTYFRKKGQVDGVWLDWMQYITPQNQNRLSKLSNDIDVLTLKPGNYTWDTLAIGNSLINMAPSTYKFGRLEVKGAASGLAPYFKVLIFYPYGRDNKFYINKNYESDIWTGWKVFTDESSLKTELSSLFASKLELNSQIQNTVESITGNSFYGKGFSEAQLLGNSVYTTPYFAGYNDTTGSKGLIFNTIHARIFNPNDDSVEWRLYTGAKCQLNNNVGYSVSAANSLLPDASGLINNFPTSDTGFKEINLGKILSIPPNTPYVLVFRSTNSKQFSIGCFRTTNPENMPSRGFVISNENKAWGEVGLVPVSPAYNYWQSGFLLKLKLSSDQGQTEQYVPELVLPPKIYCLKGLQGHIYPEHLTAERHTMYEHDVVCTIGQQRERGFLLNQADTNAPGSYPLIWKLHDIQTGKQLASKSTQLQLIDANSKNGANIKVCFIGDSLVNSGHITQRLLDIDSTDVMNIELIGTRGSGLNKHEGRGGWSINDYTGAGRTYFSFTVSGVSVLPFINATKYSTSNGAIFTVQELFVSGGTGTIVCSLDSGSQPANGSTGTLTKTNGAGGDATISYSNIQSVSGNPFWNDANSRIDFSKYLSDNALSIPDVVLIQLGVNDTFFFTEDDEVITFCIDRFAKINTLISSIKASNANIKVAVLTPPTYANQDAFGLNYGCGQTSWRANRNIVVFNQQLTKEFSNKEAQNIFLVAAGLNVDTLHNFPVSTYSINSHNSATQQLQSNGVHPDVSGYYQIGDAIWSFLKAV